MFKIQEDRCDYGRLLMPPQGYELDMAVGTTYSLDLEALTLATISMGVGEETDSLLSDNPVCLLNALRRVTDKVVLFHEAGRILMPSNKKNSSLYQLLEKMVVPVTLKAKDNESYPAFHPKMWLLAYKRINGRERVFRLVVMSRNLTFDRSWDVVVAFDGTPTGEDRHVAKPIVAFLNFLKRQTKEDERQSKIVEALAYYVKSVDFCTEGSKFQSLEVLPLGIGRNRYDMNADRWLGTEGETFHEVAIMSPFLSPDIIERFNKEKRTLTGCKRTLIARRSELGKLSEKSAGNFELWALKNDVIDGEDALSDDAPDKQQQDIHAKVFCISKGSEAWLYLGSMNATHNAFYDNVELDIRLKGYQSYVGPAQFLKDIFGEDAAGPKNPFEKIDVPTDANEESNSNREQELLLKRLCRTDVSAEARRDDNGLFRTILRFASPDEFSAVSITPICIGSSKPVVGVVEFDNMELLQLSEFYRVSIKDEEGDTLERIVKIPTNGIPTERDQQIFSSFINSKEKFAEYIAFILSDDKLQAALDLAADCNEVGGKGAAAHIMPALYETMLEASLHHQEKFREIEHLMSMLPSDNEARLAFEPLFKQFKDALKI